MGELYFKVKADFEKVVRLKNEIDSLKSRLEQMDKAADPKGFKELERQLQKASKEFNKLVSESASASAQLKKTNEDARKSASGFGELNNMLLKVGGVAALTKLASDIVSVRGEFQQLEIAFTTMLKSKAKADALMKDLVNFAATTPFDLKGVAAGTKQLLAYGFQAEDMKTNLSMLGNIASGVGSQLGDLIYLYGTLKASGRVTQMDINQFAGRGIPIYEALGKVMGVTAEKVRSLVTAGKIGFPEIEKAFQSMTTEGGMFFNLMQDQSKSITGQLSNLGDSIDMMFNNIGKGSEGVISTAIDGAASLVDNYETIGKILIGLVATYGTYKTAIMVCNVVEGISAQIKLESALAGRALTTSQGLAAVATKGLSAVTATLNKTMLANPYVLMAVAIAGVIAAMWVLKDSTANAERAQKDFKNAIESQNSTLDQAENKAKEYIETMKSHTSTQYDKIKAYKELQKLMPDVFKNMNMESIILMQQVGLYKQIAEWKNKQALIGAKTNVVMEQSEVAKYQKLYDSTIDDWSKIEYAKQLSYHQELLKSYQDTVKEMEKIGKDAKKTPLSSITTETKDARENVKRLTKELSDLRSGKTKSKDYNKDIKDKESELKDWKERLETLTGKGEDDKKKAQTAKEKANELKAQTDERTRAIAENSKKVIEAEKEAELNIEQARINSMKDGFSKQQAQIDLNHRKEMADVEKKAQELIKIQQDSEEKAWMNKNPNWKKEGKKFVPTTTSVSQLPTEQKNVVKNLTDAANINREKAEADLLQSLLDKYQDYETKRLEIEKQFNEDISALEKGRTAENSKQTDAAISEARRLKDESLNAMDFEKLQKDIDWSKVFGNLGSLTDKALNELRDKLKGFVSKAGKNISPEIMKEIMDGFEKIDSVSIERNPISSLGEAFKEYKITLDDVAKAQAEVNRLEQEGKNGTDAYKKATENLTKAQGNKAESQAKLNKSIHAMADTGQQVVGAGRDIIDTLETLGVNVSDSTKQTLQGFGTMMDALSSIDVTRPMTIITGTIKGMKGQAEVLAGLFGGGRKMVSQGAIDEYNKLVSVLDNVISKQKALINAMNGVDAKKAAEDTIALIKKQEEAARNLGKEFANSGGSTWTSSYGTRAYKALKDYSKEFDKIGIDFSSLGGRMTGLFDLSAEQLSLIHDKIPEAWAKLPDSMREYLETIIETGDEIKKMGQAGNEAMTGLSLDNAKSSLDDFLLSADTTMADVAGNFEKYMRTAILNMVKQKYLNKEMEKWYDEFVMSTGDELLTSQESDYLKSQYQSIYSNAQSKLNEMLKTAGVDLGNSSQDSTSGGFKTMSQDSADELNGRFTALQMAGEEIKNQSLVQKDIILRMDSSLNQILAANTDTKMLVAKHVDIAGEIRDIQVNSFYELQKISKNTGNTADGISDLKVYAKKIAEKL